MLIDCQIITKLTRVCESLWMCDRRNLAQTHRLPQELSPNLSRRDWRTLSDATLQRGAAWYLFRHSYRNNLHQSQVKLGYVKFAQLAVSMTVLRNTLTGFSGCCLGSQIWAATFWPFRETTLSNPINYSYIYHKAIVTYKAT